MAGAGGSADGAAGVDAVLDGPVDIDGFRRHARALLAAGVAPDRVRWAVRGDADPGLFDGRVDDDVGGAGHPPVRSAGDAAAVAAAATDLDDGRAGERPAAPRPRVPAAFAELSDTVLRHRDDGRHALLYRMLWRLQHEPGYWQDAIDPDRVAAESMARVVRRDMHKMKAFVRFRPIARGDGRPPLHVAWFEPEHHVVEAVAGFFVRRFTQMAWTVLTPLRSASWDGAELVFAAGASRDDAPGPDAGEALWLTYYASMFNPARLKMAMMRKEMPRRYWKNLPESVLIAPLADEALERSARMVAQAATEPARHAAAAQAAAGHAAAGGRDDGAGGHGAGRAEDGRGGGGDGDDGDDDGSPPHAPPTTLPEAAAAAARCRRCPLYRDATQVVFGEGPADARLMVVGEQPGDQEDLQGRPFVGPSGRLLAGVLEQVGIDRDAVYVTNAVKHFKFEMRGRRRIHKTPAQQEVAACLDWLDREIGLVAPQAIVALGATAARALLGRPVAVMRERGQWLRRDDGLPVLVTLHPSALLRLPNDERDAAVQRWAQDLELAKRPPG